MIDLTFSQRAAILRMNKVARQLLKLLETNFCRLQHMTKSQHISAEIFQNYVTKMPANN